MVSPGTSLPIGSVYDSNGAIIAAAVVEAGCEAVPMGAFPDDENVLEAAVSHAEFTNLMDDYNFELNREGKNGAEFEGGWTAAKFQGLAKYVDAHPEKLKMPRSEFDALLSDATKRANQ